MSRGPGLIMQVTILILIGLADEGIGDSITYELLARGVYDAESPTRAQVFSVARACRRLADNGHVRISDDPRDSRRKLVRADWHLLIGARLAQSFKKAGIVLSGDLRQADEISELLHELWDAGYIEEDGQFPGVPSMIQEIVTATDGGAARLSGISAGARELLGYLAAMQRFDDGLIALGGDREALQALHRGQLDTPRERERRNRRDEARAQNGPSQPAARSRR
jgi:hypothetical protein